MFFYTPTLEEYARYSSWYKQCMQLGSESSFLALWSFSEELGLERAFHNNLYWHKITRGNKRVWLPPIGEWDRDDWEKVLSECAPAGTVFCFVPEILVRRWKNSFGHRIIVDDMREEWDYLYSVERQIRLEGQAFSSIRRKCKKFIETYKYEYSRIAKDDMPGLMEFQENWMLLNEKAGKMDESLRSEHRTIVKIFNNWHLLHDVYGAKLEVDGKIIAYAVSEALDDYILSGHILKGYYEYTGVYQAMNYLFYKNCLSAFSVSNDWGDGGYENLRQAKLNFNPIGFIKKYIVTWDPR